MLRPTPVADDGSLTSVQVASWREQGYALVDGVFPASLLSRVVADVTRMFPAPGTHGAAAITNFGGVSFPAEGSDAFNELVLHPRLLAAVSQLLGEPPHALRLTQADIWPKYGRDKPAGAPRDPNDNEDQRMHCDYPNHTLTHPPPWDAPEAVEMILYLCDEAGVGGATAVVPRRGPEDPAYPWPITALPGVGAAPYVNDRAAAEASLPPELAAFRAAHLYAREARVQYGLGTLLLYRHDTWHRGTPLLPGAFRVVANLTFKKKDSEWISQLPSGWAWAMYRPELQMERLIAGASVEGRSVLGFPAPGHPYWTLATLAAVAARYGPLGMDMAPYEAALPP